MMKKYLIVLSIYSSQVYAQSVVGSMDCTVTGNVVVASEEGKFKTYSGIQGGVEANEKLTLKYNVTSNSIYMGLERNNDKKQIVINAHYSAGNADIKFERNKNGGIIVTDTNFNQGISLLPEYIRITGFKTLYLTRYYKNDWHGIFSNVDLFDMSAQTLTLNCRHINDNMDAAFKILNNNKSSK
jgi:hypothetical protein